MEKPKGYLVAVGGNEDKGNGKPEHLESTGLKFTSEGVLEEIIRLMPGKHPLVEVVTTASDIPDQYFQEYKKAFKKLGATAQHLNLRTREDANDPAFLQRLQHCSGVMLTGGDQTRLTSVLGGTAVHQMLRDRLQNEVFVVAGTSAGAACMSDTMMESGDAARGNIKGELRVTLGLGLVSNVIIDTHFDTRGRFGRLAEAVASQPGIIGIGLGEDTGVVLAGDGKARAIGSDSVYVFDGSKIRYTNITEVKEGKPVTIAGIEVYLFSRYDEYDLQNREFIPNPAPDKIN